MNYSVTLDPRKFFEEIYFFHFVYSFFPIFITRIFTCNEKDKAIKQDNGLARAFQLHA